jgi:hypothetical protein
MSSCPTPPGHADITRAITSSFPSERRSYATAGRGEQPNALASPVLTRAARTRACSLTLEFRSIRHNAPPYADRGDSSGGRGLTLGAMAGSMSRRLPYAPAPGGDGAGRRPPGCSMFGLGMTSVQLLCSRPPWHGGRHHRSLLFRLHEETFSSGEDLSFKATVDRFEDRLNGSTL